MMHLRSAFARLLGRFRRDTEAVAAVEFALIVPFLITLYLGSMEAAGLFTVDKRINSISATIGDLIGQWDPADGEIKTTELTNYMDASKGILAPYTTTGLKIVVSLVKVIKTSGATNVLWSKANAAGTAKAEDNPYADLPATTEMNKLIAKDGGCVVAAEVIYSYTPLLGTVFKTAVNFKHTNYFLPRFGNAAPIVVEGETVSATACSA